MGEFFRGWRRKAGLVTLAMATLFLMLWFRSHLIADFITTGTSNDSHHGVSSAGGYVVWTRNRSDSLLGHPARLSWLSRTHQRSILTLPEDFQISAQRTFFGAEFTTMRREAITASFWKVSYLWFILPLTLLSACLILGKTRKATAATPNHRSAPSP